GSGRQPGVGSERDDEGVGVRIQLRGEGIKKTRTGVPPQSEFHVADGWAKARSQDDSGVSAAASKGAGQGAQAMCAGMYGAELDCGQRVVRRWNQDTGPMQDGGRAMGGGGMTTSSRRSTDA